MAMVLSRRLAAVLLLLAPVLALGEARITGQPTAGFTGKGPAGFAVEGISHEVKLQDDGTVLRIIVPLAQLKTGIALRDRHMREKYLQVDQYPDAVLEVPWSAVQLPGDGQSAESSGKGKLTLHGQTHDVPIQYAVRRMGTQYQVTGHAAVNVKDFGVDIPSYFGLTLQPDIATTVTFTAIRP
jgi:polyisoprenoid-binding protein YceI